MWRACVTEDGLDYYMNTETNETTWDKPSELMSEEELNATGEWLWVPSSSEVYVPAKLLSTRGTKHMVKYEDGTEATVEKKECLPFKRAWLKRVVSDLTLLDDMGSPLILHNLRMRFESGEIYTNVGNILISINPYQKLPLYTEEKIRQYKDRKIGAQLPPHVYDVAHDAYYRMSAFKQLQSLVISGESGAGKTEVTKQALQYLAAIAGSKSGVESKIMRANPVLEAFGNAKTLRNDNSSRFGKYMEIFFSNENGEIAGANTINYLLEKIRVVQPASGERNFHIFYQLSKAAPDELRKRFKLRSNPADYYYLRGCTDVPTIDDDKDMKEVLHSMKDLGLSSMESDGLFAVVSAILALGNVTFREAKPDQAEVVPDTTNKWLEIAAEILQVDAKVLSNSLVTTQLIISGQAPTTQFLNQVKASDARHALCKFMYERMFNWLVQRINKTLDGGHTKDMLYIGILDIFGFEIFKHNSFEQLCINFTNEMLQQHFNNNTFKLEEKVYVAEGIEWASISFIDNQPMIDLITAKLIGVLPLLDEELKVPRGSDKQFLSKLADKQGKNPCYGKSKKMDPMMFCIKHYAGEVTYNGEGFLEKNRDTLTTDLVQMLQSSKNAFVNLLYPSGETVSREERKSSLASQFQNQLNTLMGQLYATEPHYVRCIKPNEEKAPLKFVPRNSYEQLTYSGVFEAVAIRKQGFPFRLEHREFVNRYMKLVTGGGAGGDLKEQCRKIIKHMKLDSTNVQVGRTRVLYRAMEYRSLELAWSIATKHETIAAALNELVGKNTSSMSASEKENYLAKLAAAVREADSFRIKTPIAEQARALLDKFVNERMDPETKRLLEEARRTMQQSKLRTIIERCDAKGIQTSLVRECREILSKVVDADAALAFASNTMEEEHLTRALAMCDEFDYKIEDPVGVARALLKNVQKAKVGIDKVLSKAPNYNADNLEKVVAFCREFNYNTPLARTVQVLNDKIKAVRKALNKAYDAVKEDKLQKALDICDQPEFNGTVYNSSLVEDCRKLLKLIQLINAEAKKAENQCIEEQVICVVESADRISYKSDKVDALRALVNGPKKAFLERQVERAIATHDMDRAARCHRRLKDLIVEKEGDRLEPWKFKELKNPMEWGKEKFWGSAEQRAATFLKFQDSSIHSPLTNRISRILDDKRKAVVTASILNNFQTVQKIMGQRNSLHIPLRCEEMLTDSITHAGEVPDEVYLSIIKQCADNPAMMPGHKADRLDANALERAISLLALVLTVFPPSKQFEDHLCYWVRQEPQASAGRSHNIQGLLSRIILSGPQAHFPRMDEFIAVEYEGRAYKAGGITDVLSKRLRLDAFVEPEYNSKNASWLQLRKARGTSITKDVVNDVERDWEKERSSPKKKQPPAPRGAEEVAPASSTKSSKKR